MKRIITTLILALIIVPLITATILAVPAKVGATVGNQTDYILLAPIDMTTKTCAAGGECKTDFATYLIGAYKFAIAASGLLAVLMIIIGGFQYMTSDAITGKGEGIDKIKNALFGLLMVLASWLILNTIDPDLTSLESIAPESTPKSSSSINTSLTPLNNTQKTNKVDKAFSGPVK